MIRFITGNILDSSTEALVNTVNTVGIMGKGIALQFKQAYPNNFNAYTTACKNGEMEIGKIFVFKEANLTSGEKWILNFPTKRDWRKPSEYHYIEKGLDNLREVLIEKRIQSISIPPLGSGNGGLDWVLVKKLIVQKLSDLDIDIVVFEPTAKIKEKLKKERTKLTEARALLLYVLFDLVRHGEFVSEFSCEKVCYFLQKFGAQEYFKLEFHPRYYGPYSGKVRYVLYALNGSYIMGFSDMDRKPFDPLSLVLDSYPQVKNYVESRPELKIIADKTICFLNGYYSDFALELLSSVDYLSKENNTFDTNIILQKLEEWSNRKRSMFTDKRYIDVSINHLQSVEC